MNRTDQPVFQAYQWKIGMEKQQQNLRRSILELAILPLRERRSPLILKVQLN